MSLPLQMSMGYYFYLLRKHIPQTSTMNQTKTSQEKSDYRLHIIKTLFDFCWPMQLWETGFFRSTEYRTTFLKLINALDKTNDQKRRFKNLLQ